MSFHLSHSTWVCNKESSDLLTYWAITIFGCPFQDILIKSLSSHEGLDTFLRYIPRPRDHNASRLDIITVWADSFSLAATREIDNFLSLPEGTKMFQFPSSSPSTLCIQVKVPEVTLWGVAPFGNLRFKACLQLTEAYRSLPRPSSPSSAKSSTICP